MAMTQALALATARLGLKPSGTRQVDMSGYMYNWSKYKPSVHKEIPAVILFEAESRFQHIITALMNGIRPSVIINDHGIIHDQWGVR